MKKIILLIMVLFICVLSVNADNWMEYGKNRYAEMSSIKEFKFYGRPNTYSVWTRRYNDGSNLFKVSEKNTGEKIKYFLIWDLYDCNNKESAIKDFYIFNTVEKIIFKSTEQIRPVEWEPVAEGSATEELYNRICKKTTNSK